MKIFKEYNDNCYCLALYDEKDRSLVYYLSPWLQYVTIDNRCDATPQRRDVAIIDMNFFDYIHCDEEDVSEIIRDRMAGFYTKPAKYLTQINGVPFETVFYKNTPISVVIYGHSGIILSTFYNDMRTITISSLSTIVYGCEFPRGPYVSDLSDSDDVYNDINCVPANISSFIVKDDYEYYYLGREIL